MQHLAIDLGAKSAFGTRTRRSSRSGGARLVAPEQSLARELDLAGVTDFDFVLEDTVKTNGRFYIRRAPPSVPSFLDALLPDVLEQTREAALYAPTGTRQYWPTEVTPYAPGSDHDLFLGIGVPSTMFGHAPDWTHHTSEDTPDKTDASELLRVGVLAANAAYFIASVGGSWERLGTAVAAETLRADGARLVAMRRLGSDRLAGELERRLAKAAAELPSARLAADGSLVAPATTPGGAPGGAPATAPVTPPATQAATTGPRRLIIPPVEAGFFEKLTGEGRTWYEEQKQKNEDFAVVVDETIRLLDGRRTTGDLADALTVELSREIPEAWTARLLKVLARLKLVTPRAALVQIVNTDSGARAFILAAVVARSATTGRR